MKFDYETKFWKKLDTKKLKVTSPLSTLKRLDRERGRERESERVRVRESECVCVRERESKCVCERERD